MIRASTVTQACYIRPSLLRPIGGFADVLDRCAAMGFQTVVLPCPFASDAQWRQARLSDPDRLAPVFAWDGDAVSGLAQLVGVARERGLEIVLDLRLDEVAAHAPVATRQPQWFRPHRATEGELPDPRRPPRPATSAVARFDQAADGLIQWWSQTLARWSHAGVAGYRCLHPQQVPSGSWRELMDSVRSNHDARFWAWTPGLDAQQTLALARCGFDAAFSSLAWWDYRAHWYLEEDARLRRFAGVIAAIDDPFAPDDDSRQDQQSCRRERIRAIQFGAATSDGVLIALDADPASDRAITEANEAFAIRLPRQRKGLRPLLTGAPGPVHALMAEYPEDQAQLVLVNADANHIATVIAASLLRDAGENAALASSEGEPIEADAAIELEPAEVRLYTAGRLPQVQVSERALPPLAAAVVAPRIAIERVAPSVDGGRFAAKHVVGDRVVVSADLLCDGHDLLHGAVLWRASDDSQWKRATMRNLGNDRWCGEFTVDRVGRHEFTVETWMDVFATARMDLEIKRLAGKLIPLDIREACQLVTDAASAADDPELEVLASRLDAARDDSQRAALLVSPEMSQAMARSGPRPFLTRCPAVYSLEAERRGAGFSSWYELFPRSMAPADADGVQRHGNFHDVIARLPAVRDMGFDVLYMPPIHPIGRINRKGRNNSVTAQPGEPGSPYAIGASEGGHDAIHPELGTLEDFRHLVAAATEHGLEVALDFAIQCSPDHPWLREHPDWFSWRTDGSIRYAENPPKKYEDIVNVAFYADGAVPALWLALRDVVAFWVNEGVRLFRVDNPHTKPFPFWEWMIGDIRGRHPDVVFLSEAFTRPKLMHRLAKVGFSQSYTYFTWRNTKRELTDYVDELAHGEGRDYFRPHFFVNTPDINPVFLQHSGRAGHLIRAALATTLSGLWGMYSGFELCEATPLPGKEEYLDSEKYQLRSWDWQRPGNIIDEITRLNLIRRLNPALQTHLGITFYNAFNDRILYYGKRRNEVEPMILVAVNLDPHAVQEADFELPLWEFGLPDHAALEVQDLWHGTRSVWHGKHQHMRLDPAGLPFSIWRVHPPGVPA